MAKTYHCGAFGIVNRLDDFLGPWVDVSIPGVKVLYDIMTNPDDEDHVVTVGEAGVIRVSTDAGATWNTPGGTYLAAFVPVPNLYEVWWSDPNTIHTVGGGGACFVSIDGGLTFDPTNTLPTPTGIYNTQSSSYALHFPTPTTGVAAYGDRIFKTTDGGNTWTQTNGGLAVNNPQNIWNFRGIHLSTDEQTIVAWGQSGVYRSTDGGNSYSFVLDFLYLNPEIDRSGEHLTWINDNTLWGTTKQNEIYMSVNQGASWTLMNGTVQSPTDCCRVRAAHFYDAVNGFYSVNIDLYETSDAGASGSITNTPDEEIWAVWTTIEQTCYRLTSCTDDSVIITSTNYSSVLGQYVKIGGICYLVELSDTCVGSVPLGIGPRGFDSCAECVPLSCFILLPCNGIGDPLTVTGQPFTIGEVVTIEEFPDTCYSVSEEITPCDTGITVTVVDRYDDCQCCEDYINPPDPIEEPITQYVQPYIRQYYRLSDDQCTTDTNSSFAENYYNRFKQLKYGIKTCDIDLDKWWIKKNLLDIRSLGIDISCCPGTVIEDTTCIDDE